MKRTHIVILVILVASIGAIISTVYDSSTYATFKYAAAHPGKDFHIVGRLNLDKELTYIPQQDANLFTFFMSDSDGLERKVMFSGPKPQDFEKSDQIVVIGAMHEANFIASKILMKCPSKYNEGGDDEMKEFTSRSSEI